MPLCDYFSAPVDAATVKEFRAYGITTESAREVLVLLSGLADRAVGGQRLYCWWAL